jgi:signal transduction histidine kinase
VARLAVPTLADWCVVDVVESGLLRRITGTHVDPTREPLLQELEKLTPLDTSAPYPAAIAVRTGRPYVVDRLSEPVLAQLAPTPQHAEVIRALGTQSATAIPLLSHGQTIGAITFAWTQDNARQGPRALAQAEEIARRAALAIENARLFQQAQDSIRMRDEFLTAASHELRTPVTSIAISAERLLASKSPLPERTQRTVELIDRQMNRLTKLINDMMSVGRIHLDRLELHVENLDLVALVRDVTERLAPSWERAGCTVALSAPGSICGRWDRQELDRVLTNLLSNATKFGAGKPIEVVLEEAEGIARLSVIDHGVGIESESLPHIFDKFERAPAARPYGGLGLGLYLARSSVLAMGGTIRAESTPGKETRFTVELPTGGTKRWEPGGS